METQKGNGGITLSHKPLQKPPISVYYESCQTRVYNSRNNVKIGDVTAKKRQLSSWTKKLSLLLVFHVRSALCAVLCAAKRSKAGFGRRMRPASGCTCTVICSLGAHSPSAVATIGPRPSAARRLTCFARR